MNKSAYLVVGVVALAGVAGALMFTGVLDGVTGNSLTGNVVKEAYELATGSDLEVMKVEDKGSVNRVVLSDGQNVLNAYVTEDGQYMVQNGAQNLIHLENYTKTLEAREDFISCLNDQNAQFYGIISGDNEQLQQHTRMAQLQIQVLGGTVGLEGLFQGPGTEGFPQQQVLNNGVVWNLNGEMQTGLKTIPQLEEATGCTYDAPGA